MFSNVGLVGIEDKKSNTSLIFEATQYLKGLTPDHYFDFTNNKAIFSGTNVDLISNIPNISGTLDLSSNGQLIDVSAKAVSISSPGLLQTYTMFIEYVRVTDSGAIQRIGGTYTTTESDRAMLNIQANDNHQGTTSVGGATIYAGAGTANTVGAVTKTAMRVQTDLTRSCINGTLHAASGTAAIPATPTHILLGATTGAANVLQGYIRKVAFFNSAISDANLQAITT